MLLATMVLGVVLVMSTMSALLNGMVSVFTVDIARLKPFISQKKILLTAKWFTVILGIIAVAISAKGLSVLYLFLVADLVCAAAAFPAFYGLYSSRISGKVSSVAFCLGILCGLLWFPTASFSTSIAGWLLFAFHLGVPSFIQGNLFWSFVAATIIPAVFCILFGRLSTPYNFNQLKKQSSVFEK